MSGITARQSGWVCLTVPTGSMWFQVDLIWGVLDTSGDLEGGAYVYGNGQYLRVSETVAEVMDRIERARRP